MLIDRENWRHHRSWFFAVSFLTLGATLWYAVASLSRSRLLGGGSAPGFTFGVVGGLICLFEFLLWPRKRLRVWRLGRVKHWMAAHIWLGLLSLPILILHSGFHLGGQLSAILLILFLLVIASGVWGLALQNVLPNKMLLDIPAETIHSQIPLILSQFREEAGRLVQATCGRAANDVAVEAEDAEDSTSTHHLVVGAVRSAGRVSGKVLQTRSVISSVAGSEPLRHFFDSAISPFLHVEGFDRSPLKFPDRSATMFLDLRTKLDPRTKAAVDALEGLCDQRRQLAQQDRLHFWLHNWLLIHLPLSIALIALMFAHIYVALKYL